MFRNIVVPLDGSTFSEHALPQAVDIARRSGARLHLVQVHEPPTAQVYPDGLPVYDERWDGSVRAQTEEYLRSVAHRAMEKAGVSPVTELLDGPVSGAIAAYAGEVEADLVVMTTHGRGGISRAWVGSVADALVRRAPVPLLLIRPKEQDIDWTSTAEARHVLIALDGSELAEGILGPALRLGSLVGARFTLVRVVLPVPFVIGQHATGPAFDEAGAAQSRLNAVAYLDRVAESLQARGADVAVDTVFHTVPALGILDYAATHAVDMIAMATHGRGGWSRVALGSVADKVMRGTMMPVMLYRPPAQPHDVDAGGAGDPAMETPCPTP
ncbi:MAG TPA: universal stress protein [Longimicrobiales bacterium]|nr:universal stress protein [Longimicrobiales bacterium]